MVMMKNMSEVSTVTLNRRVSNTKDTLVMMMALLAMLDLVVLLLMLATTQNNNSSLNQAKRRLYLQNDGGLGLRVLHWTPGCILRYWMIYLSMEHIDVSSWTKGKYRFDFVV